MQQVAHHAEHAMRTLCKEMDFLVCLQYRKLCSRKHTTRNEAQAIFLVLFLEWNNGTDGTFDKGNEPNQNQYVADIKGCMES